MNKELIKKYKKEFDHWLYEGSLLMSDKNIKTWITLTNNTWNITEQYTDILLIVINDEYVELRKALIDGKTIQFYHIIEEHEDNPVFDVYGWQDFKSFKPDSSFTFAVDRYRIKDIKNENTRTASESKS